MNLKKYTLGLVGCAITLVGAVELASAKETVANGVPTLIVTNKPIGQVTANQSVIDRPAGAKARVETALPVQNDVYTKPVRVPEIKAATVLNTEYFSPTQTMTSQEILLIRQEMKNLQNRISNLAEKLETVQIVGQDLAANYYASVATISTQLQSGTTPGNPRLVQRLDVAEDALDTLSGNVSDLNKLAVEMADAASVSNFLQQRTRAAFGLSGSVEEDHVHLAKLEDAVANTSVAIERLLNTVNDDITRAAAYMSSERDNLRILSLAISNGDLYGKSLASRPFSKAPVTNIMSKASYQPSHAGVTGSRLMQAELQGQPTQPRPLVKVRFDRPDVDFEQAIYMSVNEAMKRYPNGRFELVAVSPGLGNPARIAIESTRARRNAEKVLRNMVQMGVDSTRVDLANATDNGIQSNEVHLFVK